MEDLPFGAVLRDLNTTEIPVEYDSRYFTEEAMTVLSNYFYAIQTMDTALYQEVTLDFSSGFAGANTVRVTGSFTMGSCPGSLNNELSPVCV